MNHVQQRMKDLGGYPHDSQERISDPRPLIAPLERELGVALPSDYREFLGEFGGYSFRGFVEAPIIEPGHPDEFAGVECFFGFYRLGANRLPHSHDILRNAVAYRGRVPTGYLPIARAPGGNLICIVLHGDQQGQVYYWDHETCSVLLAAKSFGAFLEALAQSDFADDDSGDE